MFPFGAKERIARTHVNKILNGLPFEQSKTKKSKENENENKNVNDGRLKVDHAIDECEL